MINEILEILKNVENFTVTNVYNFLSNVKYKLQKNKKITYKIIEAPQFIHKPFQEVARTFKPPYAEVIENFVATMRGKLPEESLDAMYHNLKTLKIGQINNPIYSFFFGGSYHFGVNAIILGTKNRGNATTTHELLHMSSAVIGKNNMAGGFMTAPVGRSLNEGYTEVLNNRLFGHPITENPLYNTYARFASAIEDIIGRENMTNMYFSADLKSLFEQLSSYSSKEKTSIFLKDLDSLYQFVGVGYNFSSKCFDRMLNYLIDTSINYVNESIKKGILSPNEAKVFLDKYKEKVNSINVYINSIVKNKKTPVQNNDSDLTNSGQQETHQKVNDVDRPLPNNTKNYSYGFSPENGVGTPVLDNSMVRKKTKGNISYNLLFFINILLSIFITIGYLFIIYK